MTGLSPNLRDQFAMISPLAARALWMRASFVDPEGGTAIPRCSAHRPTLSGTWSVAMISSRDITIRSQPYSLFISTCHFSAV